MGLDDAAIHRAWNQLREIYRDNPWFCDVFLTENRSRIVRMLADVGRAISPGPGVRAVDIGCYNGFLCFLLGQLGYECTGVDDAALPDREALLSRVGAKFARANFNHLDPFPELAPESFDVAILGEVIEHILNHPIGFLEAIHRLLRPGGWLVLTTPNPMTLANGIRLLMGRSFTWGDSEFVHEVKLRPDGRIISHPGIHYREYSRTVLLELMTRAGFTVEEHHYMPMDAAPNQPAWKRFAKGFPLFRPLWSRRWFGMTHYVLARRR